MAHRPGDILHSIEPVMWRAVIALKVMALVYGRCLQEEVSHVLLRHYAAEIGGGRGQVDGTFEAILDQEEILPLWST